MTASSCMCSCDAFTEGCLLFRSVQLVDGCLLPFVTGVAPACGRFQTPPALSPLPAVEWDRCNTGAASSRGRGVQRRARRYRSRLPRGVAEGRAARAAARPRGAQVRWGHPGGAPARAAGARVRGARLFRCRDGGCLSARSQNARRGAARGGVLWGESPRAGPPVEGPARRRGAGGGRAGSKDGGVLQPCMCRRAADRVVLRRAG